MNETIKIMLMQLGGSGKLKAMLGVKKFIYDNSKNSLTFEFKGFRKANLFTVSYDSGKDLYVMKFEKIKYNNDLGFKYIDTIKEIKTFIDIFTEDMKPIFEDFTGLYLSL